MNWTATSDGRFKKNVRQDVPGIDFVDGLRAVTYNFDVAELAKFTAEAIPDNLKHDYAAKNDIRYSGFIAQEVEDLANALGHEFSGVDAPQHEKDTYGLRYSEFVVPMVQATQELLQKVKTLEAVSEVQDAQVAAYQQIIARVQKQLVTMERETSNMTSQPKIVSGTS